ncbi:hypothetical protein QQZ08_003772 [Neonectria magnoliae]|uniref:Uncharacterized protein n=1 Tax=Neonectria magnoliae TaxID=2732573 RepID=A0ABR1I883_9HYPO
MAAIVTVPDEALRAIEFTTIEKLFEEIYGTVGDMLLVHGVSDQQYAEIEKTRSERRRRFRIRRFSTATKTLIITIPTALHEALHLDLWNKIVTTGIFQMGLIESWSLMGGKTVRATQNPDGDSDSGEGDSTGGPYPERHYLGAWPTLVIEAGYSQTLLELRNDIRWWFGTLDHKVKIVLLVKFDQSARSIIIEKYIEAPARIRPGATTTRAAARLEPTCAQVITITENQNPGNPMSYYVTRGALRLEFDLLFLRQPRQGEGEGDIVISIQQLQQYAERIWGLVI